MLIGSNYPYCIILFHSPDDLTVSDSETMKMVGVKDYNARKTGWLKGKHSKENSSMQIFLN